MGEVDLSAVKARHPSPAGQHECPSCGEYACSQCDVPALVAEVERLRGVLLAVASDAVIALHPEEQGE